MMSCVVTDHPIVVFDAICPLCSRNAQFILKHDRQAHFRLASIQSEKGADLCRRFGIDPNEPETLLVVSGDRARSDSDAVLAIWRELGWPWRGATALRIIPRSIRDSLYRWVARNRYRLFGKRETCWMPDPEYTKRIL